MSKKFKFNLQLFGEKPKPPRYYSMAVKEREAEIYIFGDIVTPDWQEWDRMWGITSETSGYSLANDLAKLGDVDVINVYINSYGGHVSEGIAIHNLLQQHKAKVRTFCSGFACSAASVVYMAGEERFVYETSLIMVHHAWSSATGNAEGLRKAADDLEAISKTACAAYRAKVNISDEELEKLLINETWIIPEDALKWGFATELCKTEQTDKPAASAMGAIAKAVMAAPLKGELLEAPAVELRITDLEEFKALSADVAAIRAAIPSLAGSGAASQAGGEGGKPKAAPIDFLTALMGGKDK